MERFMIIDREYINDIINIKKNKKSDYYLYRTNDLIKRSSLESFIFDRECNFGEGLLQVINHFNSYSLEDGEAAPTEGQNNWLVRFFKHVKVIFVSFIKFMKTLVLTIVNFVKYCIKWIQEKMKNHSEIYKKYKSIIKNIPYDMTIDGIPFRDNFVDNLNRLIDTLKKSQMKTIVEEARTSLKIIVDVIKTGKIFSIVEFDTVNFTDPAYLTKMYEDFLLFTTSMKKAEIDPKQSHEDQMREKLNLEFYGRADVPAKEPINCKKFLTDKNIQVLLPDYLERLKALTAMLKDLNFKSNAIIFIAESLAKSLDAVNDLFYGHKNPDQKENKKKISHILDLAVKYTKLVQIIGSNFRLTIYEVVMTGMKYRNQVASMLKKVGAQLDSQMEEQVVFK